MIFDIGKNLGNPCGEVFIDPASGEDCCSLSTWKFKRGRKKKDEKFFYNPNGVESLIEFLPHGVGNTITAHNRTGIITKDRILTIKWEITYGV